MDEEEKKAIDKLQYTIEINQNILNGIEIDEQVIKSMETTLNIIDKQQKEIESRLKEIDSLYKMMSAKDEIIENLKEIINKYTREIEELKEDNNALEMMIDTANAREYRKKYIEERRKEQPNLYYPDFDEIYERYYKQKAEIEQLKENYQILKDDIEGHNLVYVDTPEFEEKYISKDKIKELKEFYTKDYLSRNITLIPLNNLVKNINILLGE